MRKFLLLFISSIIFSFVSHAQNYFIRTYGFGSISEGRAVIQTNDLGFAIAGSTTPGWGGQTNFYLIKTDSLGNTEFHYSYGGNGIEQGYALEQMPDSGFIIAGYTNSFGVNNDYDGLVIRIDKFGNQLWSKSFGTSEWDFIYDMKPTLDGNFVLAGSSYGSGNGTMSGYLVKIDPTGNIIWEKFLAMNEFTELKRIVTKSDGGFIACGSLSYSNLFPADGLVAFFDSNGDSTKTIRINNGYRETINSLGFFSNGDIALGGTSIDSTNNDDEDELMLRMDTSGNIIWTNLIPRPQGKTSINDIYINYDTLIEAGSTEISGFGGFDFHVVKFDENGFYISGSTFGGTKDDFFHLIKRTNDGSYVLVGSSKSYKPGLQSVYFVRTDSTFQINGLFTENITNLHSVNDLSIYPNPSNGTIYLNTQKYPGKKSLNFYNLLGEIVFSSVLNETTDKIYFQLPNGMYIAEIQMGDLIKREKLLVKN